jgi:hypothetical protein
MAKAFNAGGVREPESLDGSGWGERHAGAGTSLFAEDDEQHRERRALQTMLPLLHTVLGLGSSGGS